MRPGLPRKGNVSNHREVITVQGKEGFVYGISRAVDRTQEAVEDRWKVSISATRVLTKNVGEEGSGGSR